MLVKTQLLMYFWCCRLAHDHGTRFWTGGSEVCLIKIQKKNIHQGLTHHLFWNQSISYHKTAHLLMTMNTSQLQRVGVGTISATALANMKMGYNEIKLYWINDANFKLDITVFHGKLRKKFCDILLSTDLIDWNDFLTLLNSIKTSFNSQWNWVTPTCPT